VHPLDPFQGVRFKRRIDLQHHQPILRGSGCLGGDGHPSSSWHRVYVSVVVIHGNGTAAVRLRHGMGAEWAADRNPVPWRRTGLGTTLRAVVPSRSAMPAALVLCRDEINAAALTFFGLPVGLPVERRQGWRASWAAKQ
jgi:hypothetical protein